MQEFIQQWNEAVLTSLGFFWTALWAFILGYIISSLIQVLVTRTRMQAAMGKEGPRSILLGTVFGFISSSCSFSALSTTRAIFSKGAGLAPSLAFLLASTNLVIELGVVIALFLGWQFVVGEYVGGILLILTVWLLVRIFHPRKIVSEARERTQSGEDNNEESAAGWREKLVSKRGWEQIGQTYVMEWQMVWKDVLIGFTVAGIISALVPASFFQAMFAGSGGENAANPDFLSVLSQVLVGPLAAFFTFIGSMGNIPLAAVLFGNGVTFAGVMAFIFSDLVVLPVLRINAQYYGWKLAIFILVIMLFAIVITALALHYALLVLGWLPDFSTMQDIVEREFFQINYQFFLNALMLVANGILIWLWHHSGTQNTHDHDHDHDHSHQSGNGKLTDKIMSVIVSLAILWLAGGLLIPLL